MYVTSASPNREDRGKPPRLGGKEGTAFPPWSGFPTLAGNIGGINSQVAGNVWGCFSL